MTVAVTPNAVSQQTGSLLGADTEACGAQPINNPLPSSQPSATGVICGGGGEFGGYYDVGAELGLYDATINAGAAGAARLPGLWEYRSSVPGGKGYLVLGGEYTRIWSDPLISQIQIDYPSLLGTVRDKSGTYFRYYPEARPHRYIAQVVKHIQHPGGSDTTLEYDARGNITKTTLTSTGGGQTIVNEAGYDLTCVYQVKCNKPNWVKDPKLKQTDFVYNSTHGMVESVKGPADGNGKHPETRYQYGQRYAWVAASGGGYVQAASSVWLLTSESYCRTSNYSSSSCESGASDEVVTTYDYGPNSGPNNLWLRGVVVTAEGQSLRTCYTYDVFGNKLTETAPNANLTSCQ